MLSLKKYDDYIKRKIVMEPIITVKNLTKVYATYSRGGTFTDTLRSFFKRKALRVTAVNGISFEVPEGSITAILGPNGAGKSTTVKMLTGVLFPTAGEVSVMGYTPWAQRTKYVAHIGAVFGQKSQLIWDIPPIDSFNMNRAIYGIPKAVFEKNLAQMAEQFDVVGVMKKPTRTLSLGERMRCEFIMAMLHDPRVIFLDEPTIGLDLIAKDKIREFILKMNGEGKTFILTTHDVGDIERLADSVIVINRGEIVFAGGIGALRGSLGAVRTVRIVTKTPVDKAAAEGIDGFARSSGYEAVYSIDIEKTEINAFISLLSGLGEIADLSVTGPDIESVIKKLYLDDSAIKCGI